MADEAFGVALVLAHGWDDTRIHTGGDYSGITVLEAFIRTPTHKPKGESDLFIPSSYRSFDGRSFEIQRQKGIYWMLTADIDSGNHSLEEIKSIVIDCFGVEVACRIYSSSSATTENKKWRFLIPLVEGVPYQTWTSWQKCLILYFKKCGVTLDDALSRSAQPVVLPNTPDPNQFYESEIFGNELLEFTACHKWMDFVSERLEVWRALDSKGKPPTGKVKRTGISSIDEFNRENRIDDLLGRYGYKHDGRGNWRSPLQTTSSFATKNMGDHWVSLSGSDRDAGLGRVTTHGHSSGKAFSLYCFYEFNGSVKDALRSLKK